MKTLTWYAGQITIGILLSVVGVIYLCFVHLVFGAKTNF